MVVAAGILLVLIVLNGLLSMAEIAVVSSRRIRLEHRAEKGDRGAAAALELLANPTTFLSTVQIGITLVGIVSGAFAGETIGEQLGERLKLIPVIGTYGAMLGFGAVVGVVTYLSLVIGELVPKRLGMANPEAIASAAAPVMKRLAAVCSPFERVLTASTELVVRLAGLKPYAEQTVTEEEIRGLVEKGTESGVVHSTEHRIVEGVFELGDLTAGEVMTPRGEIEWLDVHASREAILKTLETSRHASFPVGEGGLDSLVGLLHANDLAALALRGGPLDLKASARTPLVVPETLPALSLLEQLRAEALPMALVVDEHGDLQGLVSLGDLMEALVGRIGGAGADEPDVVEREDGSWLVDGRLPVERLKALLQVDSLPGEDEGGYQTLAGFVLMRLGRLPTRGEVVHWGAFRFEVVDLDRRRIDQVLVSRVAPISS